MQLVILAAGQGIRLGSFASDKPKSLVDVHGKPYLALQLEQFSKFNFSKKIIVGGFGISHLKQFLASGNHADIELVNNTEYRKGNLYSLLAARDRITEGFYLFNADHYYSPKNYQKIFSCKSNSITAFCDFDRPLVADDMKVESRDGFVVKMDKHLETYNCGYVGITYVPSNKLDFYLETCDEMAALLGDKANVESVIHHLAQNREPIAIHDISGSWWTEIDTPEDLEKARALVSRNS